MAFTPSLPMVRCEPAPLSTMPCMSVYSVPCHAPRNRMDHSPSRYSSCPPTLRVDVGSSRSDYQQYLVHARFRIGRAPDCEVRIDDQRISRYHADGLFYRGEWWIR